ncbi:Ig-like domain-containing protein, partial [Methylobacterium soli]|uniref:Ig-like domain-containing protein n=1 Tax=Methylobacterium soli TaxID=553447 RepID=UPI001FD41A7A
MAEVTQTFGGSLNQAGNPLVINGYAYAQRSTSGSATGTLSVQNFGLFNDAQLRTGEGTGVAVSLLTGPGYLSISQVSGGAFDLNQLDLNSGVVLGAATNTQFVGYRNGVQVVSGDAFQLLNLSGILGDQTVRFGSQWDGITEVRIFNSSVLDIGLGRLGFRIDDIVTDDHYAPTVPTLIAGAAATRNNTPTITGATEAGATVAIYNGNTQIGTAVANSAGQYSFTPPSPLADGTYSLSARATDASGNTSAASTPVSLIIDTLAPAAPAITTVPTLTNDNTPTITGSAEAGSTVAILSGTTQLGTAIATPQGTFSFTPTTPLADGPYVLRATAIDAAGNVSGSSAAVALTIDSVAPGAPAITTLPGLINNATPIITGTAEVGATVTISDNGTVLGTAVAGANGVFSFTPTAPLVQGANSLTATARDAAGNVSGASAAVALTIDSVAPGAPAITTLPGLINNATPIITGTAEAGTTVTISDNGTVLGTAVAGANGVFSFTPTTPLAQGANSLTATARDTAGNVSSASAAVALTIDSVAPGAPAITTLPGLINNATPIITGTAEAGATVTISDNGTVLGTAVAGANGVFSFTPTAPLVQGTNSLTAIARDAAGNVSGRSAAVALTIDSVAPGAPAITTLPGLTNNATPIITGTAEVGATVTISDNGTVLGTAVAGTNGVFSFTPTAPLVQGANSLTATARDAAGNVSGASAAVALTIDSVAPGVPAITTLPGLTNNTTPIITGTAEVGATVTISDNGTVLGTAVAGANGVFSFTPTTPLPQGANSLTATARDAAGNVSGASAAV